MWVFVAQSILISFLKTLNVLKDVAVASSIVARSSSSSDSTASVFQKNGENFKLITFPLLNTNPIKSPINLHICKCNEDEQERFRTHLSWYSPHWFTLLMSGIKRSSIEQWSSFSIADIDFLKDPTSSIPSLTMFALHYWFVDLWHLRYWKSFNFWNIF